MTRPSAWLAGPLAMVVAAGCAGPQPDQRPAESWPPRGSNPFFGDAHLDRAKAPPAAPVAPTGKPVPDVLIPRQALSVLRTLLLPQARYELLYEHMLSEDLRQRGTREQVISALQSHHGQLARLTQMMELGSPTDVAQGGDQRAGLVTFALRKQARRELAKGGIWGLAFKRERGGWRLHATRPDVFATMPEADRVRPADAPPPMPTRRRVIRFEDAPPEPTPTQAPPLP